MEANVGSILLVDNDTAVCEALERAFRPAGFEFAYVTTGPAAVDAARALKPDVILLDIMLPEVDGFEVCRRLRQIADLRRTPIIFLTGLDDDATELQAYELGAHDYVKKPFSPQVLVAKVRRILDRETSHALTPYELRPGMRFAEKYKLLRELGRGAMSVVFLAEHEIFESRVALKVMACTDTDPGVARERFEREARALATLRHPNLVRIYDAGTWGRLPYIAMETITGGTVADQIKALGRLPARRALEITIGVAEGMHHAHENGILHRDLKTANVLLTEDGTPVITDFGLLLILSEDAKRLTEHGIVVGTPHSMSPEQIRTPNQVDARSDVYAIGVLLYEMLTGKPPFHELNAMEAMTRIMREQAPPPRTVDPTIPLPADLVCMRALANKRERRYPTARGLAEAARHALSRL